MRELASITMRAWPKPERMSPDGLGFFCLVRRPLLVLSKSKRAVWARPSSDDGLRWSRPPKKQRKKQAGCQPQQEGQDSARTRPTGKPQASGRWLQLQRPVTRCGVVAGWVVVVAAWCGRRTAAAESLAMILHRGSHFPS